MVLGGFICMDMVVRFQFPFLLAVLISICVLMLISLVIERAVLRPLLAQPILTIIMATLAVDNILQGTMLSIWTGYTRSFPQGLLYGKTIHLGPLFISHELLYGLIVSIVAFILVGLFFYKTHTGLKMRVTAESHEVAMSLGINVNKIFAITWMLAAAVAALAGIFIGNRVGLQVNITSATAFKALPAVIFGGLDSLAGAIIGGFVVGILERLAGAYISTTVAEIAPYVILLIVLIIKPEGIFGIKRIERI